MYMYHLSCICHTHIPEIRACPEIIRVFQYVDVHDCEQDWSYSSSAIKIIKEDR